MREGLLLEDKEIIDLLWQRNPDSLLELDANYHTYCFSIALNIVKNKEDAEECVSDTWFKMWQVIPPSCPKSLKSFAGRITRNLALNRYRDEHTNKRGKGVFCVPLEELAECLDAGTNVEDAITEDEINEIIQRFIKNLKTADRKIFLRRYYFADDIPAIAKRFGMTNSNVKVRLHRIRMNLKKLLEKGGYIV